MSNWKWRVCDGFIILETPFDSWRIDIWELDSCEVSMKIPIIIKAMRDNYDEIMTDAAINDVFDCGY